MKFLQATLLFATGHMAASQTVPLQPFCGDETTGTDPLTGASSFCEAKDLDLPTKQEACVYYLDSSLTFEQILTSDHGVIAMTDCPPRHKSHCTDFSPTEEEGEVLDDTLVAVVEKCQLKRADVMLKYEPNFPVDRPDVYIEVEIIRTGQRFEFFPSISAMSHDKDDQYGLIPLNDRPEVFDILFNEQDGELFKFRYTGMRGPGDWNTCSYSPIAFDLNHDGVVGHIRDTQVGYEIDITGDGSIEKLSEWFAPEEGILIDAHNAEGITDFTNGVITGDHLMGDMAGTYTDGFAKLKTYDENCDDKLSGHELDGLYIWRDSNSNLQLDNPGLIDDPNGELFTLNYFGIVSLNTIHDNFKSYAELSDGSHMLMEDLWFDAFEQRRRMKALDGARGGLRQLDKKDKDDKDKKEKDDKDKDKDKKDKDDKDKKEKDDKDKDKDDKDKKEKDDKDKDKDKDDKDKKDKDKKEKEEVANRAVCDAAILCGPKEEAKTSLKIQSNTPVCEDGPHPFDTTEHGRPAVHFGDDTPFGKNPKCEDMGYSFGYKIQAPGGGEGCILGEYTFPGSGMVKTDGATCDKVPTNLGSVDIVCSGDEITGTLTPTEDMIVIMKGGPGGVMYHIEGGTSIDLDVGDTKQISHIEFCFMCEGCPKEPVASEPSEDAPAPAPAPEPSADAPGPSTDSADPPAPDVERKSVSVDPSPPNVKGDPHFKTFGGEMYDFHGECDLVLLQNPQFHDGLGMSIHLRTKIEDFWSSVESAAIQLGEGTMEINANPDSDEWLWVNGEVVTKGLETGKWHRAEVSEYLIRFKETSPGLREANIYYQKGGSKEYIGFKTFKSFVRVDVDWKSAEDYKGSMGLLGSFDQEGKRLGRDGAFIADTHTFGQEWQVADTEPKLFHSYEGAVQGKKCIMPPAFTAASAAKMKRRLRASKMTEADAEKACDHLTDAEEIKACVFDVLATQDLSMASAW